MQRNMKSIGRFLILLPAICAFVGAPRASAQSVNVDIDIFTGPPELGNGAPSDSFGAAANQPGRWNRTYLGGTQSLLGLDGLPSSVTISFTTPIGFSTLGARFEGNTGDFAL